MKTRFLVLLVLCVSVFQANAQFKTEKSEKRFTAGPVVSHTEDAAASSLSYRLCDDDLEYMSGVNSGNDVRTWICIPAGQWKGNKITSIDIGLAWEAGKDAYLFISGDLDREPEFKQEFPADTITVPDGTDLIGWRNMPLTTPYIIDSDKDLYVGFCVTQDSWPPLALDGKDPVPGGNLASYRKAGTTEWKYSELSHNVAVRVNMEGDNFQQNHLRMISCSTPSVYNKPGEINVTGTVINDGLSPVNSLTLSCLLDGESPVNRQVTDIDIPTCGTYTFTMTANPTEKEGKRVLTLTVSEPNGEPDEFPENTSRSIPVGFISEGIQKTILVQETVSLDSEGIPAADAYIRDAIENNSRKENIIWLRNHALINDDLSIEGYTNYSMLFMGTRWLPSVQIDHTKLKGTFEPSETGEPIEAQSEMFMIDEHFGEHLQTCLDNKETYLALDVNAEVTDGNLLKYSISAEPVIQGLYAKDIYAPQLAVLIMEDDVESIQEGVDGPYFQKNTPRAFLNDNNPKFAFMGDPISISDNGFTKEGEYLLTDQSWKLENLYLVAYVLDGLDLRVKNAAISRLLKPDALLRTEAPALVATYKEGRLHIDGDFDNASLYTATGELITNITQTDTWISLSKGIYLIKVQNGATCITRKMVAE